MEHPLDGAQAWLDRAEEHLHELKVLINDFIASEHRAMLSSLPEKVQGGAMAFLIHGHNALAPPRANVIVGEIVQALRRVLDYLVYELAILDSGSTQRGTQFPIEPRPQSFRGRHDETRKNGVYLVGLNTTHVTAIESLQPYKGVQWTRRLAQLSNPDKHRHLLVTSHATQVQVALVPQLHQPGTAVITWTSDRTGEVVMQFHLASDITFDDGTPVVETLEELKTQVAETVALFKPEFDRLFVSE